METVSITTHNGTRHTKGRTGRVRHSTVKIVRAPPSGFEEPTAPRCEPLSIPVATSDVSREQDLHDTVYVFVERPKTSIQDLTAQLSVKE